MDLALFTALAARPQTPPRSEGVATPADADGGQGPFAALVAALSDAAPGTAPGPSDPARAAVGGGSGPGAGGPAWADPAGLLGELGDSLAALASQVDDPAIAEAAADPRLAPAAIRDDPAAALEALSALAAALGERAGPLRELIGGLGRGLAAISAVSGGGDGAAGGGGAALVAAPSRPDRNTVAGGEGARPAPAVDPAQAVRTPASQADPGTPDAELRVAGAAAPDATGADARAGEAPRTRPAPADAARSPVSAVPGRGSGEPPASRSAEPAPARAQTSASADVAASGRSVALPDTATAVRVSVTSALPAAPPQDAGAPSAAGAQALVADTARPGPAVENKASVRWQTTGVPARAVAATAGRGDLATTPGLLPDTGAIQPEAAPRGQAGSPAPGAVASPRRIDPAATPAIPGAPAATPAMANPAEPAALPLEAPPLRSDRRPAGSETTAEMRSGPNGAVAADSVSQPSQQAARAAAMPAAGGAEAARAVAPQIAGAIAAHQAPGRIELQLDPPELGRVEIALEIADQGLRATVSAERGQTADLLRRHGEILLQQLADAGFADVDLRFGDGQRGARGGEGARPGGSAETEAVRSEPVRLAARPVQDGLDLRL